MTALVRSKEHTDQSHTLAIETHNKIIKRIDLFKASGDSSLDLSNLGLEEVPKEILDLPLLSNLDLSKIKLHPFLMIQYFLKASVV